MAEMLTGQLPWYGCPTMAIIYNVVFKQERPELPDRADPGCGTVVGNPGHLCCCSGSGTTPEEGGHAEVMRNIIVSNGSIIAVLYKALVDDDT
eukprot:1138969-Pelagomonas_calceolata.AAC.1